MDENGLLPQPGGFKGLGPIGVDLDPHADAIADCVLVGVSPFDWNAALSPLGCHPHKDEHALIVNIEEPLGFELQGTTPPGELGGFDPVRIPANFGKPRPHKFDVLLRHRLRSISREGRVVSGEAQKRLTPWALPHKKLRPALLPCAAPRFSTSRRRFWRRR